MAVLKRKLLRFIFLLALLPATASARVVINEVFYHAPDSIEDLEYIELHNTGDSPIDLSGWTLTKGIKFKFAPGTFIGAKGFLVLCRNEDRFKEFYDTAVAGVFAQSLSNRGERLQLSNASGGMADAVKYQDASPWPMGADGYSGSLERICPEESGEDVSNWASSPLSEDRLKPAGTPGKPNANFSPSLPPAIANVKFAPQNPKPDQSITVEADVRDPSGIAEVNLRYRLAGPGFEKPEATIRMNKMSESRYAAIIPGQPKDQLIRFRIQATGMSGAQRFFPAETEPRPAFSSYVHDAVESAAIPFGWIINTTEPELRAAEQRGRGGGRGGFGGFGGFNPQDAARMQARMLLQNSIDLPGAWFELTVNQKCDLATIHKLKTIFAAKVSDRDKIIDETIEASNIEEKLKSLPDIIRTFRNSLIDTLKPHLTEQQNTAFVDWLNKQQQPNSPRGGMIFGNPTAMVKNWVNLEGAWYAVSVKAEIDAIRFDGLRNTLRELFKERNELAQKIANLKQLEDGFRELREQGDILSDKVAARLKPVLSPAQEKQFQDWQGNRNPFGAGPGFMARPPGGGGFRGGPGGPGGPGGFRRGPSGPTSSRSAFVYFDPATQKIELFDFVQVVSRSGGQKVHFHKDQPLHQMTTINLLFENDNAVLVEPLSYEVYRKAGMAAPQSYHVRLWQNGQPLGFYALVEQPNRAFLRRNKMPDDGNLYKILWYERGVIGQHEKKTHLRDGHDDVVTLVNALETSEGDAQWAIIRKNFDVAQVANYFAVNTVLSHWDGFFNNYFTYHDTEKTGKWTMYPWDQDNTWGTIMGRMGMTGSSQVFYNMPITFGMKGDVPPGQRDGARQGRGFGFGGGGGAFWWRQPGYFSGPLLANPQFRKTFLARTKEILETMYTEEIFGPIIDGIGERLKPEVKFRAEVMKTDPARAIENLEQSLQSLREHVKKRREFLLAQDEIKNAERLSASDSN